MASSFDLPAPVIIKSDRLGRSRYSAQYKSDVLAAFHESAMSGAAFAKQEFNKLPGIQSNAKAIPESYQRHLWRWRKKNGKPLGISTQRSRLSTLKDYFAWLTKKNLLPANPASELELPRQEKRLPVQALTLSQVKAVLNVPDSTDLLGIRDRAILEVFYSAGLRRGELARLELTDLNRERQTLHLRLGKGHKDRVVPVGNRALEWLEKYLEETRSRLVLDLFEKALFLTS